VSFSTAKYAALFADEAREHLAAASDALLALERAAARGEAGTASIDAAFRAVHTVKGMSGTMGYAVVERIAHEMEHVLSRVRDGVRRAEPALVDALLVASDALDAAVRAAVDGGAPPDPDASLAALRAIDGADADGASAHDAIDRPRAGTDAERIETGGLRVAVRIARDAALPGVRAFMALQRARSLGEVRDVRPPEEAFQASGFDGAFTLTLLPASGLDAAAIERAVRAAGDVERVEVETPRPTVPAAVASASDAPVARESTVGPRHVRMDAARLDALLDLAGELVTARGRLTAAAAGVGDAALAGAVADVSRLVAALQEQVLESRLVPVAEVFDRMPRLVRDAARATGKRVELETDGTDVAVDRAVLDALGDPLGHLLRNAVDHGIESVDARAAAGKSATGRIFLRAARERDSVAVSVEDDGRGVDASRVLARARERGLVDPHVTALDDDHLLRILASPGFSTAAQVTAVSGRGVGIDAVVARVRQVGGTLSLETRHGAGTTWTLRLPLTLAVARALLARTDDGTTYALPLAHVRETVDLPDETARDAAGHAVLRVRDEQVPLVALHDAVAAGRESGARATAGPDPLAGCTEAAVVEVGGRRLALAVPAFTGQPDLVVKRLPSVRGALRIFGGATILDTGAVALIVDVPALLSRISP
jgi:two-component system chemotaxis sensor kinase CheA